MESNLLNIVGLYPSLEKDLGIDIKEAPDLKELVNFKKNDEVPVHRWYYFKEGYSHQLVEKFLDEFDVEAGSVALDPFAGSGTTLLACQWRGIEPKGIDINPFFKFVQRVKLDWHKYDQNKIKEEIKKLSETPIKKPTIKSPALSSFKRVYTPDVLEELLFFKEVIEKHLKEDTLTKDFFRMGLASILEDVSLVKKDGKGLKFVKDKVVPSLKQTLLKKLGCMLEDLIWLNSFDYKKIEGEVFADDTRKELDFLGSNIDFVMFSPPYLNTFDYTEVYKLELWFLEFIRDYNAFKGLRSRTLRSHNLWNWEPTRVWDNKIFDEIVEFEERKLREGGLWSDIIPTMIRGYFDDMYLSLNNIGKVMRKGAYCIIVVGNSSYGGVPIPTDLFLAKIGQERGFEPIEIRVARYLGTSSQQMKAMRVDVFRKYLRESVIILRKS